MVGPRFEDSRGGACVERHLAGAGVLVDGRTPYNRLAKSAGAHDGVRLFGCFRRRWHRRLQVQEDIPGRAEADP
jgi:hypothetical protein